MADDDQRSIHENYTDNDNRLASIKKRYDPGNLFRPNQNIKPAGCGPERLADVPIRVPS